MTVPSLKSIGGRFGYDPEPFRYKSGGAPANRGTKISVVDKLLGDFGNEVYRAQGTGDPGLRLIFRQMLRHGLATSTHPVRYVQELSFLGTILGRI